jgi:leucyl aminopeptidase
MTIAFELTRQLPADVDAVVLPACSDQLGAVADHGTGPDTGLITDLAYLRARGFEGKVDQLATLPGRNGAVVFVIGLGPSSSVGPDAIRRAAASTCRAASRHRVVASYLLDAVEGADRPAAAQAMAEGIILGGYRFNALKSSPEHHLVERCVVVATGGQKVRTALDTGVAVAGGVVLARDLVNEPGGSLTPPVMAERLDAMAADHDLECTIWDERAIAREQLGGLLGVNRGSTLPPRFVQLRYAPAAAPRGRLALVGKGITFDSGGLSIKTGAGMMTMKDDMGGAAAVAGAFSAFTATKPRCEVRAYLPLTDNMSDGDATRPGDVLVIRGGKTVEVLNTDAEGRLVLADALVLASEAEPAPDAIVDLATLTGAVEGALGQRIAGLMGNHEGWIDDVRAAGARSGERLWPLPLPADYRRHIDSDVADLRNIGRVPAGGSLTAGLFLQEFVGEAIPWVHLDIAGTAWSNDVDGELAKGGTGFGVRLLVELAGGFRKPR